MNKRYEYGGLIYCEDDLSEEIDNYGGSLYNLFYNVVSDGRAGRAEIYYRKETNEPYEDYEDLIESEFSELEVEENE